MSIAFVACAACSSGESPGGRVFDACEPLLLAARAPSDAELASLDRAITAWRVLGVMSPTRASADASVQIVFEPAASAFYGYYDGDAATIYINSELAAGSRVVAIAHELGHALGLAHVAAEQRPSVMNPGNLMISPTQEDRDAIVSLWGACASR